MFERAGDLAERLEGDARIERGGFELLVPEQHLDHADDDTPSFDRRTIAGRSLASMVSGSRLGEYGYLNVVEIELHAHDRPRLRALAASPNASPRPSPIS
jgi:hypothetical protein